MLFTRKTRSGDDEARHAERLDTDGLTLVADYWRECGAPDDECVDDATWNDLDMDAVFEGMRFTLSTPGDEVLYGMLRRLSEPDALLMRRRDAIKAFERKTPERARVRRALRLLGQNPYHSALGYMFHASAKSPGSPAPYIALAALPILFLALGLINPLFLLGIAGMFAVNAVLFYVTGKRWMREIGAVRHIARVLRAAGRLSGALPPELSGVSEELASLCREMKPISRWNALFAMQRQSEMDFLTDYLRITFQLDMLCLIRLVAFFVRHGPALARMYALVGEIDACQAIAAYRASGVNMCEPEFVGEFRVSAEGLTHPLISDPVPNDLVFESCVLITGSNASGKSTFIKAMAVNLILAQSVMTCTAARLTLPRARVMTSMALRDSVRDGESYFIVEIKSLKRILDALSRDTRLFCFIDEILRGTNTIERVAASSALLTHIQKRGCLCMAATHDHELTRLCGAYRQLHFREELTEEGMRFTYKVLDGPSDTQNAIALLGIMGFPGEVTRGAEAAARRFRESGSW